MVIRGCKAEIRGCRSSTLLQEIDPANIVYGGDVCAEELCYRVVELFVCGLPCVAHALQLQVAMRVCIMIGSACA